MFIIVFSIVVTSCDETNLRHVFDENFQFKKSYDVKSNNRNLYRNNETRAIEGAAYRSAKANREVEKKVLSAESCVLACLTEKDFKCRECDYFQRDGGKCALYATKGKVFQEDPTGAHDNYVGDLPSSDHYILYKNYEEVPDCPTSRELFLVKM